MRNQRERLVSIYSADHLVKIEDDFKQFKVHVAYSSFARKSLDVGLKDLSGKGCLFDLAWEPFKGRFRVLHDFCGGLATIFPGTATVESDFYILQWERKPSRLSLIHI